MRFLWRAIRRVPDRALLRDAAALALAVFAIGTSFGALAVAAEIAPWMAIGMSALIFAGGAQFLVVGVVAAGGSVAAAVVGGLLLNARHLPFGLAVADVIGGSWPKRLLGAHLLVDETVAFATSQPDRARARRAYWTAGSLLFLGWNVGTVVGVLAGQALGDPKALGIDAAFPAALLALLLPSLRERAAQRVAAVGTAVALLAVPLLPPGLPVICALAGLVAAGKPRP